MWCGGLNDKVTEEVRSVLYPLCCTLFLVRRYGHREGETKYYSFAAHFLFLSLGLVRIVLERWPPRTGHHSQGQGHQAAEKFWIHCLRTRGERQVRLRPSQRGGAAPEQDKASKQDDRTG